MDTDVYVIRAVLMFSFLGLPAMDGLWAADRRQDDSGLVQ